MIFNENLWKIVKIFCGIHFFFEKFVTVPEALTLRALTLRLSLNVTTFEKFSKIDF